MLTGKQFEDYLRERRYEPASANLAERIIAMATEERRYADAGIITYLREVISAVFPKPAYAVAVILIIGIFIGAHLPMQSSGEEFATSIYEEEAIL